MKLKKSELLFFLGAPGSGKTNLVKFLILKNKERFNFGLVFTGTKFDYQDYSYIPEEYIIQGYQEDVFEAYLSKLEEHAEKYGKAPFNFIVFDDLLGLLSNMDTGFINFLGNRRHYNCCVFFCSQYLRSKIPVLRDLTHKAFIFRTNRHDTMKCIYEEFGTLFEDYEDFKRHFQQVTKEKHVCMLYDREVELEDNYMYFLAPDMSKIDLQLEY